MTLKLANPFSGIDSPIREYEPLAAHTWFKIGGPARWYLQPRSVDELQQAAARCTEANIPIYVLGLGANLLVGDDGVNAAVFRLDADAFRCVVVKGQSLEVGAGMDIQKLVLRTVRVGLAGIECLAGIPGTVGGAIRMNAGGKFGDIGATVRSVRVMDTEGNLYERTKDDLLFEYRHTNITAKFIVGATLELEEQDPQQILNRTKEIWMYKRNTQPLSNKSAGCIFKNANGQSAGLLIDQAGLKGMRLGGAEISTKHANFIISHPGCLADDVLRLIKLVKEKVHARHGIDLESEVQIWP